MKRIGPILIIGLMAMAASCTSNECYENHSALPLAYFYNMETGQQVSLQSVRIYGIGAPGDSVLYPTQNLQEAYLPFRIWQDTTQYVFEYMGMLPDSIPEGMVYEIPADTVSFIYEPKEWFVSPACGAMYFFDIRKVEHSSLLIDSVSYNELITNENSVNIKIFFKESIY